jgi:FKBP-type peptidyl-prolyl cis-trans isomerase (trigger factor)
MTKNTATPKDLHDEHCHDENCTHEHHHHAEPAWAKQIAPDEIIKITIPWEKLKTPYENALTSAAKNIKLDGFRKGKVPANIAKEQLNPEYLVRQVLPNVMGEFFAPALEKSGIKPVGEPEFSVLVSDEGKDWEVEAHLATRPDIKLKDYAKLLKDEKTAAKKKIITDDQETIKKLNDNAKKAGKDEEAKPLEEKQVNQMATDRALNALHSKYAPNVSRLLVMRQAGREADKVLEQLQQFNVDLATYLKNTGMTADTFNEQMISSALQNLQMEFLLEALIDAEKITADTKKLEEKVKEFAPEADDKKQKELLADEQTKIYLEAMVKRQALADWLLAL